MKIHSQQIYVFIDGFMILWMTLARHDKTTRASNDQSKPHCRPDTIYKHHDTHVWEHVVEIQRP